MMTDQAGQLREDEEADVEPPESDASSVSPEAVIAAKSSSKTGLILTIIILALVLIGSVVAYNILAAYSSTSISATADVSMHSFTMKTVDGQDIELSELAGRPMVLNFWASTCGPCKNEMPEFQRAYEQYGDQITFVMVNISGFNGETERAALSFLDKNGYGFPVYFDTYEEGSVQFEVSTIPRTYFINSEGYIVLYANGSIDASTLQQGIDSILDQ